jgi:hypothetical protein
MVELAFSFFVPASCMSHDIVTTARKVREIRELTRGLLI